MAASLCCEVFEEKVVAHLPRSYSRSDKKLTPTERERLSNAFSLTWRILMDSLEDADAPRKEMASLNLKEMFLAREVAIFIVNNIPEAQLREIARLMGDGDKWDESKCIAKSVDIIVAGNQCLEDRNVLRFTQPDQAPLGLWAVFDHWQDYMDQFE